MKLKQAVTVGITAGMILAGVAGTTALACSSSDRSGTERAKVNAELFPWASQACLQQEEQRLWHSQISTSRGDNLQHNALMLRLCELEHSIEEIRADLEATEARRQ